MGLLAGVPRQARAALVAVVAACGLAAALPSPAPAAGPLGQLHQLGGTAACWSAAGASEDGAGTCGDARAMQFAVDAVFSPDGRFLYVGSQPATTSPSRSSLTVYGRDPLTGGLAQLPGAAGCVTRTGTSEAPGPDTCLRARALNAGEGAGLAVTRDGRFLYAASRTVGAIVAFSRNPATGDVVQLAGTAGCVSKDGEDHAGAPTCADGHGLGSNGSSLGPAGLTLSPDERFLYVTNTQDRSLLTFQRDGATGVLTQLPGHEGCISLDGSSFEGSGSCANGRVLGRARRIAITTDGRYAYAPGLDHDGFAILRRDPASGILTQSNGKPGCITLSGRDEDDAPDDLIGDCLRTARGMDNPLDALISPNGRTLYVSGNGVAAGIAAFTIDPASPTGVPAPLPAQSGCVSGDGTDGEGGQCTNGRASGNIVGLALTPDGSTLYAVSFGNDSVAAFSVDPGTGALAQLSRTAGCISATGAGHAGEGNACTNVRALNGPAAVAITPDGVDVAITARDSQAVAVFRRELPPACSGAAVTTAHATPVTLPLSCTDVNGDAVTRTIAQAPGAGSLGAIDDAAGTVVYTPNPGFAGTDTVSYRGGDGVKSGADASVTIAVDPPPPPPPGPPPPPPLPVDAQAPACRVVGGLRPSLRKARSEGFDLDVRCDERAEVRAEIRLASKDARRLKLGRKTVVLFRGTVISRPGRRTSVALEPVAKVTKKLRKVKWSRLAGLRPTARVVAADRAGNKATVSAKLRWKK